MKTYTKIIKEVEEKEINAITCDFCNKTKEDYLMSDITEFSIAPGYGSIYDDHIFNLDICDGCLTKLLDSKVT